MSVKNIGLFEIDSTKFSIKEKEFESGYMYSVFNDQEQEIGIRLSINKDILDANARDRIIHGDFLDGTIKLILGKLKGQE
jgi:hypothetical protein